MHFFQSIENTWNLSIAWIFGIGGTIGLFAAGIWMLWFFCPAILVQYKNSLLNIAIGATVLALSSVYFTHLGAGVVTKEWIAANKKIEAEARQRDADIAKASEVRVQVATRELQEQADLLQKQLDTYAIELAKRPKVIRGQCVLTPEDVRRLQQFN